MYDYKTYCQKNKLKYSDKSLDMWIGYCEVSKASTDMKDEMYYNVTTDSCVNTVSFAPYPYPQVPCTVPCTSANVPQKKEKTMYVDNDKHIESSKINYLSERLSTVYYNKIAGLKKSFGLVNDAAPETAVELVKRIQDGKYVLSDESKNKPSYEAARYITWRDPSVKEDKAGFDAAMTQFKVVYQDAQDAIAIQTPAEALVAIKALDAWTPTV